MPRRKGLVGPTHLSVTAIRWRDARGWLKDVLHDTSITENFTVGFVVYEDDEQIILLHEIEPKDDDYMKRGTDGTQILKVLIIERIEGAALAEKLPAVREEKA